MIAAGPWGVVVCAFLVELGVGFRSKGGLPNVRFELWPGLEKQYRTWIGEDRFIQVKEAIRLYRDSP